MSACAYHCSVRRLIIRPSPRTGTRRFRQSDLLRRVFETVPAALHSRGSSRIGEGFAVDASLITISGCQSAERHRGREGTIRRRSLYAPQTEYLAVLDDIYVRCGDRGYGVQQASSRRPIRTARWTGAHRGLKALLFALLHQLSDRCRECDPLSMFEATTAIRQAEVLARASCMIVALDGSVLPISTIERAS